MWRDTLEEKLAWCCEAILSALEEAGPLPKVTRWNKIPTSGRNHKLVIYNLQISITILRASMGNEEYISFVRHVGVEGSHGWI
jgi:hypothetical protein